MAQSNMMGKLVDTVQIVSTFSDLEKAVIKASKHNTKAPKEKHVRKLIVYIHEQGHRIAELINLLAKRLEIPDWIVVMKALVVFHRLMKDSKPQFIAEMRYRSSIFNLRRFADLTTPEAHHQSLFVRKYSQYLEEKVLVFKLTNVEFEKDPTAAKALTTEEAFEKIPRVQSQLNALLNCRASKDHINNNIIVSAFTLLLKDSFKLYSALNDGIINLLETYFTMSKPNAMKALEIYKLFTKETDGIIQFFEISRRFSRSELPELQHAPITLVEALENYIKDLEEGKSPNPNSAGLDKVQMAKDQAKMTKAMDDFHFDNDLIDADSSEDEKVTPPSTTHHPTNNKQPAPASFDPFGFDSATFAVTTPTVPNSTPAFDPFAPVQGNSMNTVSYVDKKKQIETLMNTAGTLPVSNTPLAPTPVPQQQQQPSSAPFANQPFFPGMQTTGQPQWGTSVNPQQQAYNNPFMTQGFPQQTQNNFNPFA